jgi:hypothetical protein
MARAFDRDTPVLAPGPRHKGKAAWLLWPAMQFRVVSPLLDDPQINVFQRALLGLARCGKRDLSEMASLLGLEPAFAKLVQDDLRTMQYLDQSGALTEQGALALEDGFLDPTKIVVTHVYQDPFSGMVWPASVATPVMVNATWTGPYKVQIAVPGGRGAGPEFALEVPGPDPGGLELPETTEVIEQISRGHRIETWGEPGPHWQRRPPKRLVSRVSLLNSGEPVYIPVQIVADRPRSGDADARATWQALNPFSGRTSARLRSLVANHCASHEPLRRRLESFIGRPPGTDLAAYDQLKEAKRDYYRQRFELEFGSSLRGHPRLEQILTVIEFNWDDSANSGDPDVELGLVTHYAWRIHEVLLREISRRWPVSRQRFGGEGGDVWNRLRRACQRIGLDGTEYLELKRCCTGDDIKTAVRKSQKSWKDLNNPELLVLAVLSADHSGGGHPIRRLVEDRPRLLTELTMLAGLRNRSSHAEIGRTLPDRAASAREITQAMVRAYLMSVDATVDIRKRRDTTGDGEAISEATGEPLDHTEDEADADLVP